MKSKILWITPVIIAVLTLVLFLPPFLTARVTIQQALGLTPKPVKINSRQTKNTSVKVYDLVTSSYRGKIMLVKIKDPRKIQIALAKGGLGKVETTSSMAKRNGVLAAVNGGGFINTTKYKRPFNYPLHITIHNGKLVSLVKPIRSTSTIGISSTGKLVVDGSSTPQKLIKQGVREAVSFGPLLIKNGKAVIVRNLPPEPRTAIGQKKDGTFIFVVIDGRRKGWSNGATFKDLQKILLQNGAWTAANLDGGGSSTIYYNGKLQNKPSDITGERRIATSIVIYP